MHKKIILYTSIVLKLIVLSAIGLSTAKFIDSSNAVYLSERIVDVSHRINVTLLGAETGQRGFIITDDESYLEPYNYAVTNLDQQLNDLTLSAEAAGTQFPQVENITNLAHAKMIELFDTIKLRKTQSFEAARKLVSSDTGAKYMDQLKGLLNQVITQENLRIEYNENIIRWTGFIIIGGLIAFALLAVVSVYIAKGALDVVTYPLTEFADKKAPEDPQDAPNSLSSTEHFWR